MYPNACCIDGLGRVLQQRSGRSDSGTEDSVVEHGVQDVEGRLARQKSIRRTIPALTASTAVARVAPRFSFDNVSPSSFSLNVAFFSPFGLR